MTYEIMVIATAERNWKLVKVVNSVQRDTTITLKSKQHTLVYGTNHQLKAGLSHTRLSSDGRLQNDDYFKVLNMDE